MFFESVDLSNLLWGGCFVSILEMFICVLAFCNFTKSLSGSYTKTTIPQIERRFGVPSSVVGIIDGSFEMGNLLVITVVSYFGTKFHRPRIIGAGVLLMAMGTLLMGLPHFLMGRYEYENVASPVNDAGNFTVTSPCSASSQNITQLLTAGCEEESSLMWIIVLLGNVIRGIGEASVGPLGMAFIDDYARPENSAFYIGCLQTISVIDPLFGFSLGSLCANLYVDIGSVDKESVLITPQDSHWVGAWWLGYLVAGALSLLSAVPFWFLPRALPEVPQPAGPDTCSGQPAHTRPEQTTVSLTEIAKDFVPSLKRLLSNKIYILYLIFTALIFNSFVITVTYTPKYFEQHFGQSISRSNFLLGITSIPAMTLGVFLSGVIMKRFNMDQLGAAKMALVTYGAGFLCTVPYFVLSCSNMDVAGATVPYQRRCGCQFAVIVKCRLRLFSEPVGSSLWSCDLCFGLLCRLQLHSWFRHEHMINFASVLYWTPAQGIVGANTFWIVQSVFSHHYFHKNMSFHDCRCVQGWGLSEVNSKAVLGQCPRESSCSTVFYIYLALESLSHFVNCMGSMPLFLICLRSLFLGLIGGLQVCGCVLLWITVIQIKKKLQKDQQAAANMELQKPAGGAAEALLKEDTEQQDCLKHLKETV